MIRNINIYTRCLFCLVAASLILAGCGKQDSKAGKIVVLVYIDRSESTRGYARGNLEGFQTDCVKIGKTFLYPILRAHDGVLVQARAFVRDYVVLFSKKVDKIEEVSESLMRECKKRPYKALNKHGLNERTTKTLFSCLIDQIGAQCKAQKNKDFYVLVLTDGHPDEPFADIEASAKRFAEGKHGNLKCMLVAPVLPSINMRWRENLENALAPLGTAVVANNDDFRMTCEKLEESR